MAYGGGGQELAIHTQVTSGLRWGRARADYTNSGDWWSIVGEGKNWLSRGEVATHLGRLLRMYSMTSGCTLVPQGQHNSAHCLTAEHSSGFNELLMTAP